MVEEERRGSGGVARRWRRRRSGGTALAEESGDVGGDPSERPRAARAERMDSRSDGRETGRKWPSEKKGEKGVHMYVIGPSTQKKSYWASFLILL